MIVCFYFQMDKFFLELGDLGDIDKVMVGHDGDGIGSGWFLEKVIIKAVPADEDDDSDTEEEPKAEGEEPRKEKTQKKYIFPCERWLDVGEDDKMIERELLRVDKEKTKVDGKS